jgi:uncharacterized heparinase superfamily protein
VTIQDNVNRAFAPLDGRLSSASGTVGTTAAKIVTGAVANSTSGVMVRVLNLSTDKNVALKGTAVDASVGTVTATGASTDGIVLSPGQELVFNLRGDRDLYIVGSDTGAAYNLATW